MERLIPRNPQTFEERLEELESIVLGQQAIMHQFRRQRRLLSIALSCVGTTCILILLGAASASQPADIVKAKKIVIVDAKGREMIRLWGDEPVGGGAAVELLDAKGDRHLGLGVSPEGFPGIAFFDKPNSIRMGMGLGPTGTPGFHLDDERGVSRMLMRSDMTGEASITLINRAGRSLFIASEETEGRGGRIRLLDGKDKPRLDAGFEEKQRMNEGFEERTYLRLLDETGQTTFEAPTKK
jgi:hypothetical protein